MAWERRNLCPPRCGSRRRKRWRPRWPQSECDTINHSGFNVKLQKFLGHIVIINQTCPANEADLMKESHNTNKLRKVHLVENVPRWAGGEELLNSVSGGAHGCAPESERHMPHLQQGWERQCPVRAQRTHVRSKATTSVPVNETCVCTTRATCHSHWPPDKLLLPSPAPGPFLPCMLHLLGLFARGINIT